MKEEQGKEEKENEDEEGGRDRSVENFEPRNHIKWRLEKFWGVTTGLYSSHAGKNIVENKELLKEKIMPSSLPEISFLQSTLSNFRNLMNYLSWDR